MKTKETFSDEVSPCPHCFCGTHTLSTGNCGKCGGAKAKVGTSTSDTPPSHKEVEEIVREFESQSMIIALKGAADFNQSQHDFTMKMLGRFLLKTTHNNLNNKT